jgi:hypothetical protein
VREHLGVPIPPSALDALRPDNAGNTAIRTAAIEALFLDQQHKRHMAPNVAALLDEPTWRKRLILVAKRLFPPREDIAAYFRVQGDSPIIYWLYVRRWVLLAKTELPKLGMFFSGNHVITEELNRARIIKQWLEDLDTPRPHTDHGDSHQPKIV